MTRLAREHWLLLLVVCAGFVWTLMTDWSRTDRAPARMPASPHKKAAAAIREIAAPVAAPIELDRLARRRANGPAADPFESRGWITPRAKEIVPPDAPAAPQAPPVPFVYQGKWTERDRVVVMLGREGRTYLAKVNEVLDGTYRIDSIEANYLTLTYLPLGARQTLAFELAPGTAVAVAAPALAVGRADAAVRVAMPAQVAVGEEFTITVSLDPRRAAIIEHGSAELVYDPKVLHVLAVGSTGFDAASGRPDPGRVALDLGGGHIGHSGPASTVRVRVVTATPATTQVHLAALLAVDQDERDLAVAVDGPNPQTLAIVAAARIK